LCVNSPVDGTSSIRLFQLRNRNRKSIFYNFNQIVFFILWFIFLLFLTTFGQCPGNVPPPTFSPIWFVLNLLYRNYRINANLVLLLWLYCYVNLHSVELVSFTENRILWFWWWWDVAGIMPTFDFVVTIGQITDIRLHSLMTRIFIFCF